MELKEFEDAITHGLTCRTAAESAYSLDWELKATVVVAQAHFSLENFNEAQTYFQAAQYITYVRV